DELLAFVEHACDLARGHFPVRFPTVAEWQAALVEVLGARGRSAAGFGALDFALRFFQALGVEDGDATELLVVDRFGYGRMVAADRAGGVVADFEGAGFLVEAGPRDQTPDHRAADGESELYDFGGL